MHEFVAEYFTGERLAGAVVGLAGAIGLLAAALLYAPRWELRPFAIVLAVLGLLELVVGLGLWIRTGPQVAGLLALLADDPARMIAEESARMTRVQATFVRLEIVWVALIAGSLAVAFSQRGRPALWSAALAVLLHAAFLFVFDSVAERRGAVYLSALTRAPR
ncbi:MAG: hypothetical protein JNL82_03830 [Myxococcales bacterium]|jgi:hypothetical protein|nr:hypothetical protein [Myxococcales bacterium]